MFKVAPNGFWSSQENQMKYMEWLGGVLKIKKMDDWYGVTKESFTSNNGTRLLKLHRNSPSEVLISLFPKHDWKPWMFEIAPHGFWSLKENQMKYMEWLGGVINVNSIDEWRSVPRESFAENHGTRLLSVYRGSIETLVSSIFTEKLEQRKQTIE